MKAPGRSSTMSLLPQGLESTPRLASAQRFDRKLSFVMNLKDAAEPASPLSIDEPSRVLCRSPGRDSPRADLSIVRRDYHNSSLSRRDPRQESSLTRTLPSARCSNQRSNPYQPSESGSPTRSDSSARPGSYTRETRGPLWGGAEMGADSSLRIPGLIGDYSVTSRGTADLTPSNSSPFELSARPLKGFSSAGNHGSEPNNSDVREAVSFAGEPKLKKKKKKGWKVGKLFSSKKRSNSEAPGSTAGDVSSESHRSLRSILRSSRSGSVFSRHSSESSLGLSGPGRGEAPAAESGKRRLGSNARSGSSDIYAKPLDSAPREAMNGSDLGGSDSLFSLMPGKPRKKKWYSIFKSHKHKGTKSDQAHSVSFLSAGPASAASAPLLSFSSPAPLGLSQTKADKKAEKKAIEKGGRLGLSTKTASNLSKTTSAVSTKSGNAWNIFGSTTEKGKKEIGKENPQQKRDVLTLEMIDEEESKRLQRLSTQTREEFIESIRDIQKRFFIRQGSHCLWKHQNLQNFLQRSNDQNRQQREDKQIAQYFITAELAKKKHLQHQSETLLKTAEMFTRIGDTGKFVDLRRLDWRAINVHQQVAHTPTLICKRIYTHSDTHTL